MHGIHAPVRAHPARVSPPAGLVMLLIVLLAATGCRAVPSLETGRPQGDDTIVTLDNPDFSELVNLTDANTKWNGKMAREIDVTNAGFKVTNGDYYVETWNGDGPAKANGVSAYAAVSDERLPARPDAEGHYASNQSPSSVTLMSQGLRVGFKAMLLRLYQVEPNYSTPTDFSTLRVRLDPKVALVPVEVVVVYHEKDAQGMLDFGMEGQRLPKQLAFWDRVPTVETAKITDGTYGELTSATHGMAWYRRDAQGQYMVATQTAPDTVWDACGVQFRMVNYFEMQVPSRNVYPIEGNADADPDRYWPRGTVDDAPLRENIDRAHRDPHHMDGTVTVIMMGRVSFPDAPEVGRAITGLGAIGVSLTDGRGTDGVVAHELGHLSGLGDASGTEVDANGKPLYNVMVGVGPGVEPTQAECDRFKRWGDDFTRFWTEPHDTPDR